MRSSHFYALIALTICALGTNLYAERTCRLIYPERPNDAPKAAFIFDGKLSMPVMLTSMNFSPVVNLPDGNLTIAMTAQQIFDPKALLPDTPLLKIPEHVRDFYIIISPNPDNKSFPIQMNLVDIGGGSLMPGQTLWYNLTPHRIVAKLGNTNMKVEPNGKTTTEAPLPESGYYVAEIAYQADGKAPLAPITKQSWWYDAKSRHLGFIASTGGKLPKLYYYRDYRIPEAEKRAIADADPEDLKPVYEPVEEAAPDPPSDVPADQPPPDQGEN